MFANKKKIKNQKIISLDLTLKKKIFSEFNKIKPDIIIHAAALTNMELCEKNKKKAKKVNELTTKTIADYSYQMGCKLIFISTDNVFFNKKKFKTEKIKTNSKNFYGITKINSENYIKKKIK